MDKKANTQKKPLFLRLKRALRIRNANKAKMISFFGVFDRTAGITQELITVEDLQNVPLITVAATEKEAFDAVDKLIYFDHFGHYKLWCECRSLPVGAREESWKQYKRDVITVKGYQEEFHTRYAVLCMSYTPQNLTIFLRMFSKCRPLLTDFEDPKELAFYIMTNANKDGAVSLPVYLFNLIDADPIDGAKVKELFDLSRKN